MEYLIDLGYLISKLSAFIFFVGGALYFIKNPNSLGRKVMIYSLITLIICHTCSASFDYIDFNNYNGYSLCSIGNLVAKLSFSLFLIGCFLLLIKKKSKIGLSIIVFSIVMAVIGIYTWFSNIHFTNWN